MLPCGSKPTSRRAAEDVLLRRRIRTRRDDGAIDGRRPAADHHQHLALRAELGDQVGAFVHRPDVVVLVDADRVREFEAVIALADFLDEGAVLVEFEQARRVAAVIDEDVALRVGGDGDRFAQILSGRKLEEIRDGGEGDFRHARDRRLLLGRRGTGQEQDRGARGEKMSCHGREPIPGSRPFNRPSTMNRPTQSHRVDRQTRRTSDFVASCLRGGSRYRCAFARSLTAVESTRTLA